MTEELIITKLIDRESLIKAIEARHSVRRYSVSHEPHPEQLSALTSLVECINENNKDLSFRIVNDEPKAFGGRWASYGNFLGVRNYIVVAGKKGKETDFSCGLRGEEVVLMIQHLGLNSCWVGLTYKKIEGAFEISEDHEVKCLIAFGHGETDRDRNHKIKTPAQVSNISETSPAWFKRGIDMALLAPTAVNQQKFFFTYEGDDSVKATSRFSLIGYSRIDLGIVSTHFIIGANNSKLKLNL